MKKQETKEEMEERDAAGYARRPSEAGEFDEWEGEQVWPEDEPFEHDGAMQQMATTGGETNAMEEGLKQAAEIRHKLEGRHHSDSTKLVSEDRGFTDDSSTERDLTLPELLAGVTEENRHAEVDFGRPVGKEKC